MNEKEKQIAARLLAKIDETLDSQAIQDYQRFLDSVGARITIEKATAKD